MRIWIDPERLSGVEHDRLHVTDALREQNGKSPRGTLDRNPTAPGRAQELTLKMLGRLSEA